MNKMNKLEAAAAVAAATRPEMLCLERGGDRPFSKPYKYRALLLASAGLLRQHIGLCVWSLQLSWRAREDCSSPPSTMAPTEIMTMEDYCTCHTHAALLLPGHQATLGTRGGGCRFISQDSARICLQTWPRSRDAAMAAPSASRFLFRHANAPDRRLGPPAHQVWSILALPFLFALLQAARSAWRTWT